MNKVKAITAKFVNATVVLVLVAIALMPGITQYFRHVPPVELPVQQAQAISVAQVSSNPLDTPLPPDGRMNVNRRMGPISLLSFMLLTREKGCRYVLTLTDTNNSALFSTGPGEEKNPCSPNKLIGILKKIRDGALAASVSMRAIKEAFDYLGPEIADKMKMAPDVAEAFKAAVSNLVK